MGSSWTSRRLSTSSRNATVVERLHRAGAVLVAKLSLGIVELENGVRITGQLKVPKPKLGMAVAGKVEIVREAEYSKNYGMVFYPA